VDGNPAEHRIRCAMTLHFAYGANMSRAVMRRHAPEARAVGRAELRGHRFIITADGYGSVEQAAAETVRGVLWRISPRDRVKLDAWENVKGGLYRATMLPVRTARGCRLALVYIARRSGLGRPKPGYVDLVVAAASDWAIGEGYVGALQRSAHSFGADARKIGEFL
jgi:hypothetical protein